jgi:arylsulfatase A-like enzyme
MEMNMKRINISVTGLLLIAMAAGAAERPNILFISIDDLRPELGCYGNEAIISPNIDRLAESGTVFEEAYCQVPVCGASRASLMTGLYPTAKRFVTYYTTAQADAAGIPDIPTWFKQNGYTTISNGKIYHDRNDNSDSWDDVYRPQDFKIYHNPENIALPDSEKPAYEGADVGDMDYAGGAVMEKTLNDIRAAKEAGKPFFIAAGFTKPHLPFNAPKKYWDLYDRKQLKLADNPFAPEGVPEEAIHQWNELRNMYGGIPKDGPLPDEMARTLIHGYYACVSYSDAMVGKLLDELDRLGLRDNTIVMLWGDHGWQLGEHSLWCKHALFTTSLNAPLIISAPGFEGMQRTVSLVEFVDIYPTLCELAGLELPPHLQGKSLVPLLKAPAEPFKEAVFGRYHGGEAVRMGRYLYAEWTSGGRMLYDHSRDPDENINVANNPEYGEIVEKMARKLENHREHLQTLEPSIRAAAGTGPSDNEPPAWKERTFQQKAAVVGEHYEAHINWRVTDAEEDELVYAKVSGPEWLTVTQTQYGRIEGTPTAAEIGENVFIVSVSDGINPPVQARMELEVVPAPKP